MTSCDVIGTVIYRSLDAGVIELALFHLQPDECCPQTVSQVRRKVQLFNDRLIR